MVAKKKEKRKRKKGETHGRTWIRFSCAPGKSGITTSHSNLRGAADAEEDDMVLLVVENSTGDGDEAILEEGRREALDNGAKKAAARRGEIDMGLWTRGRNNREAIYRKWNL